MSVLLHEIYRFNAIPIRIPMPFFVFCKNRKTHPKIQIESQGTPSSQKVLKRKNKAGRIILPIFKTYCKATVIKIVQYWHKDRHSLMWNTLMSNSQRRKVKWWLPGAEGRWEGDGEQKNQKLLLNRYRISVLQD